MIAPAPPAQRPRVAHITTVDLSLRLLLLRQMQSLQAAGYDVVGISTPGDNVPGIEAAGIPHIALPMSRNFTPLADIRSLLSLIALLRREGFTVVHTHTPKAGLLGQLAARFAKVPVIVNTVHGFYFHEHMAPRARRFYVAVEKIAAWCSDAILSQNGEDLQTAIREHICPAERIAHLGNGIDLTNFDPDRIDPATEAALRTRLQLPVGTPVVGYVGRLAGRRKGFLDFLAAARAIAARLPAARFLIVGAADSGKPDAVEPSAAADYGIAERCIFVGHVPPEDLPPYYRLMDTLVLPSLFEGIPRVVMEASAMGVPSVVSDVKGNREAVEPGRNGLLVPLGDVPALAAAILHLLENPDVAARFAAGGRSLAAERFDERIVFQRVRECYETQLRRKGLAHWIPSPLRRPAEAVASEKSGSLLRS